VTASVNQSSVNNVNVVFLGTISADWNISGATGSYTSGFIKGYTSLGFVAEEGTTGPTSLIWGGTAPSPLSTELTDESGNIVRVNFTGQRRSACTTRSFNSANACEDTATGMAAILNYSATDNPDLPAGVYHGVIHFSGKDWNSSTFEFDYKVSVGLTVE